MNEKISIHSREAETRARAAQEDLAEGAAKLQIWNSALEGLKQGDYSLAEDDLEDIELELPRYRAAVATAEETTNILSKYLDDTPEAERTPEFMADFTVRFEAALVPIVGVLADRAQVGKQQTDDEEDLVLRADALVLKFCRYLGLSEEEAIERVKDHKAKCKQQTD